VKDETEKTEEWLPDRSKFKDDKGRYLTQSLFIELSYSDPEWAIYTLTDEDKELNGRHYVSLRKLYLEMKDPTEYAFATKYLWGWEHWQKIVNNAIIREYIDRWRDELEVKIRSDAVRSMLKLDTNFNAVKWAADGHWNVRRGRPSKNELEREKKMREKVADDLKSDSDRVVALIRPKEAKSDG
jgi:hypothetical protein